MTLLLSPDRVLRAIIEKGSHADSNMCWTCGSCDFECPVNIATGCLRPQKIVRLANLGYLDALLTLPEIWYCFTCRRCSQICPNSVKPATLITYARHKAIRQELISIEQLRQFEVLFRQFQHIRWHAVNICLQGENPLVSESNWQIWSKLPHKESNRNIPFKAMSQWPNGLKPLIEHEKTTACYTCGECSSACPVSGERNTFDPRTIARLFNLGLTEELLETPAIWLCIACGRCSEACSQRVDVRMIIRRLQATAINEGSIDNGFRERLERADRKIFSLFLGKIDALYGFKNTCVRETLFNADIATHCQTGRQAMVLD